jgi:uncharacterized protein YjbI with pentapeptide repeats
MAEAIMANEEHVKRLRRGVKTWNTWYDQSTEKADLRGADLRKAQLVGVNLIGANLEAAKLDNSNLDGADFVDANLRSAQLTGANLTGANVFYSTLDDANLAGSTLHLTCLHEIDLKRANLAGATLSRTIFADVDLSHATGLDSCFHEGPSAIDYRTLKKSGWLPLSFLRGVGMPETLIEYLPSLLNPAIQFHSCFISYSAKDQEFADRLHADLQDKGVRCWFAPHDMPIGGKLLDEIDAAIRLRDKVLLILSKHSIKSDWVEDEVLKGFEEERKRRQITLFPIRLDDAILDTGEAWAAKLRDQRHIGDFRGWKNHDTYRKSFERVLRDLRQNVPTADRIK